MVECMLGTGYCKCPKILYILVSDQMAYANKEQSDQDQHSLTFNYFNPCPAELNKMPHPFLIFSHSDYLIQIVDMNLHT